VEKAAREFGIFGPEGAFTLHRTSEIRGKAHDDPHEIAVRAAMGNNPDTQPVLDKVSAERENNWAESPNTDSESDSESESDSDSDSKSESDDAPAPRQGAPRAPAAVAREEKQPELDAPARADSHAPEEEDEPAPKPAPAKTGFSKTALLVGGLAAAGLAYLGPKILGWMSGNQAA
jgi:hypothetical protein